MEVDKAGNRVRRAGAQGFPQSRFGGGCPKLPVHAAFGQPGQILVEPVEMPDGAEFLLLARTLEGPQGAFAERPRRTALLAWLRHRLPRRGRLRRGAARAGARRPRGRAGADAGRPGLPALRARRLPGPRRAAGDASARPRRDGRPGSAPSISSSGPAQVPSVPQASLPTGPRGADATSLGVPLRRLCRAEHDRTRIRRRHEFQRPLSSRRAPRLPAGLPVGPDLELRRRHRPLHRDTDDSWTMVFWRSFWAASSCSASCLCATAGAAR